MFAKDDYFSNSLIYHKPSPKKWMFSIAIPLLTLALQRYNGRNCIINNNLAIIRRTNLSLEGMYTLAI